MVDVTESSRDAGEGPAAEGQSAAWKIVAAVVVWFGCWCLTPGLRADGIGSLFTADDEASVLIETLVALSLVLLLLALHRRYNRELFARSRWLWAYVLPIAAGIALPSHYGLSLPVALYMFWMTVSVFWQDYLTFGLLQKYLAERLPVWAVLVGSAAIFWAGHALLLPDSFGPTQVLPSVSILVLGFILASLRVWTGTLHLILALHLTFYFIFA